MGFNSGFKGLIYLCTPYWHTEVRQYLLIFLISTADTVNGQLNAKAAFIHEERVRSDNRMGARVGPGAGVGP